MSWYWGEQESEEGVARVTDEVMELLQPGLTELMQATVAEEQRRGGDTGDDEQLTLLLWHILAGMRAVVRDAVDETLAPMVKAQLAALANTLSRELFYAPPGNVADVLRGAGSQADQGREAAREAQIEAEVSRRVAAQRQADNNLVMQSVVGLVTYLGGTVDVDDKAARVDLGFGSYAGAGSSEIRRLTNALDLALAFAQPRRKE